MLTLYGTDNIIVFEIIKRRVILMFYNAWAFVRQSLVRIHLGFAGAIHKISGGKLPKSLFTKRSGVEKVGTSVRVIERNGHIANIAKFNPDGSISDDDFVILSSTDFHYDEDHEMNQIDFLLLYITI